MNLLAQKIRASRHYEANKDQYIQRSKDRAKTEAGKLSARKCRLKKLGITYEHYIMMLELQGYECKICRKPNMTGKWGNLYVDHNHVTGEVRGLLCQRCNVAIGLFNDDPELLRAAIEYVSYPPPWHR
jgi:hypothetical protein